MSRSNIFIAVTLVVAGATIGSASASASVPTKTSFCENDRCQLFLYCEGIVGSKTGCDRTGTGGCMTYDCDTGPTDPEG